MKISFLKEHPGSEIELNKLLLDNSIEYRNVADLDELIEKIGKSKYVLLGESTHGTHEYYTLRTQISKRLIEQKGFSFIAVEGDWPDCYRLNRYIKNYPDAGKNAYDVLHTFNRWPTWMWANWEIVALAEWMNKHNARLPVEAKIGFYGLDVYSLWESLEAIIKYLEKNQSPTSRTAAEALKCFEPYNENEGQSYALATLMVPASCEKEVLKLLTDIRKNLGYFNSDRESALNAEQNAYVTVNAEKYYRTMVRPGVSAWNIRDHHMVDTLERLIKFHGPDAKAIVWAHNTHIGDARSTDMARSGMVNIGQLLREKYENSVHAVGFGTYKGTVLAGSEWGDVMRILKLPSSIPGSWEYLLHHLNSGSRIVFMTPQLKNVIDQVEFVHRAVGVVYHPKSEHLGNYVPSIISDRYDSFIYLEETSALHPIHLETTGHQVPETFPFGL
jgi:erythromycin esterase